MDGEFKAVVEKAKAEAQAAEQQAEAERLRQAQMKAEHLQRARDWLAEHIVATLEAARDEVADDIRIDIDTARLNGKEDQRVTFTISPAKLPQGRLFSGTAEAVEVANDGNVTVGMAAIGVGHINMPEAGPFKKYLKARMIEVIRLASR